MGNLGRHLLLERQNLTAYFALSIISDTFDFSFVQNNAQMNLLNVDLSLNYTMTILCKLQTLSLNRQRPGSEKQSRESLQQHLVLLAFYRAISFGQVLQLHQRAMEEINYVVEHRSDHSLPSKLVNSKYFEFFLSHLKQTSFENMRR